jgi:predicted DNA-binding antitoxin AbrB/MazE fold protein
MAKHFTAVYEEGVLRPEHPLDLPEGEPLHLIVVTQKTAAPNGNVANALAEIAALPLEGDTGACSGAEHDSVLYPHS